ncbi:MAG: two-component regulator propeller domain-containing protein, partial [Bacteroidota bacterium]|nr:two-component regulator propeller domain-containing protein [Bacteroidota bacterium]
MKTKQKIWIFTFFLMGIMPLLLTTGCSKSDDNGGSSSGNGWSALGNKDDLNNVFDIYVDKSGYLYAVGDFKNSNGKRYVAKWDGSKWSEVGNINVNNTVYAIAGDANGNLYIGGDYTDANGVNYIEKWNGSTWTNIGNYADAQAATLCTDPSGMLYESCNSSDVYKYNGTTWSKLNMTGWSHWVNTVVTDPNGNLYIGGGALTGSGGSVGRWNGSG